MTTKDKTVKALVAISTALGNVTATGPTLVQLGEVLRRIEALTVWLEPVDARRFPAREDQP
ncbi:MAG TPA: hypothetical protein VMY35_11465 [Phycisphaerae bacterium]|nr:hypothetical protein [Phycisphaerae bacterium]